ncbi:hypothetical protein AcV7_001980 [Taiwanofungus camphoratus]|nr:hypothetical protein AcV7_001980 [Antrodia cinnamomea]
MKRQRTAEHRSRCEMTAFRPENIPVDILPLIFEHLVDRRDLHNCAQLSRSFNLAATPILYRTLDSRLLKTRRERPVVLHPSRTLLQKPQYAKYVRRLRETSAVALTMSGLIPGCYEALRMCNNLEHFSWSDDSAEATNNDQVLLEYLNILQDMNIKELVIRTYLGLSEEVWSKLIEFRGLRIVAIWTMEGQPRILQGWSERLGPSLTQLELGRCAGVPASILVSVISHLPLLKALRLKGAPTSAILEILTYLPNLVFLDTEYFGSGITRYVDVPVASLRELTVRTSSVDVQGPQQLWTWIRQLLPRPSLESFTLNAFSTQGDAVMPRSFLLDLALTHKDTFKHFNVDSAQLTLEDVQLLCTKFPALEALSCSVALCQGPDHVAEAIANGHNLRRLRLHSSWVPSRFGPEQVTVPFTPEHARKMMLRDDSRLRVVGLGRVLYTGQWVQTRLDDGSKTLEFEVIRDFAHDL